MSLSFMNAANKVITKSVSLDDARLPSVIYGAVGNPSPEKVLEVIEDMHVSLIYEFS